jgi:hypothetical protein
MYCVTVALFVDSFICVCTFRLFLVWDVTNETTLGVGFYSS